MCAFGIVLCLLSAEFADGLNFIDLNLEDRDNKLVVTAQVQPFADYETLADEVLGMSKELKASLDAPFQMALQIVEELDRQRTRSRQLLEETMARIAAARAEQGGEAVTPTLPVMDQEPEYIATFRFILTCRDQRGQSVGSRSSLLKVGLAPKPGHAIFQQDGHTQRQVSIDSLSRRERYHALLARAVMPLEPILKRPQKGSFIVDLFYTVEEVNPELEQNHRLEGLEEELRILRTLVKLKREEQLGITYRHAEQGRVEVTQSAHLRVLRDLIHDYQAIKGPLERRESVTPELESLVARAPAEASFLALLAREYAYNGRREQAYAMLRRLEPLVTQHPRGAAVYREILALREGERRKLLARRKRFHKADDVHLEIITPAAGDYVGGEVAVDFRLLGKKAPLFQVDLKVNGRLTASIQEPPNVLHFKPDGKRRLLNLELTAWFKDKTYARASLPVRYLYIADEETVQLISLRTVVSKGGSRFLTDLASDRFHISEGGQERALVRFKKDEAPLRIAVLVDTSGSMAGEKLYKAQYAVNTFLDRLEPQDQASVYAFDHKVIKFDPHRFGRENPRLFTMRPQLTTSLHDALMVAHNDLRDQEGTKVIIVLSDGIDSTSRTDGERLKDVLRESNVLVYPIILEREQGLNRIGAAHLEDLAQMTGSVVMELASLDRLEKAFTRIHQELKSFYFLDFYSSQRAFSLSGINIDIRGSSAKARFRRHLNNTTALSWSSTTVKTAKAE